MIKLNIGCGNTKVPGYINIDAEKKVKPNKVHDITKKALPYKDKSVSEILFFHTIEHIEKIHHVSILREFARVLKNGGKLYISYPNFEECSRRYIENFQGKRRFWEATIYGLQRYESDYHVCAIIPSELTDILMQLGFEKIQHKPEPFEPYNMVTLAIKNTKVIPISYEKLVADDTKRLRLVK